MHYYQFNIGDYASHTRHLTDLEDLAYRRLLDAYYLQERPLNVGVTSVARQINMRNHEEAVKAVLEEFFELTEAGWIHRRADREIEHYRGKVEQARNAGKASAQRRSNARSTDVQPTNNQEPITNNQEPNIKHKAVAIARPDDVEEAVWKDFLSLRKAKRSPLTETALERIRAQAVEAKLTLSQALQICCSRGWQGFEAGWVKPDDRKMVQVEKPGFFMGRKLAGVGDGQP